MNSSIESLNSRRQGRVAKSRGSERGQDGVSGGGGGGIRGDGGGVLFGEVAVIVIEFERKTQRKGTKEHASEDIYCIWGGGPQGEESN